MADERLELLRVTQADFVKVVRQLAAQVHQRKVAFLRRVPGQCPPTASASIGSYRVVTAELCVCCCCSAAPAAVGGDRGAGRGHGAAGPQHRPARVDAGQPPAVHRLLLSGLRLQC